MMFCAVMIVVPFNIPTVKVKQIDLVKIGLSGQPRHTVTTRNNKRRTGNRSASIATRFRINVYRSNRSFVVLYKLHKQSCALPIFPVAWIAHGACFYNMVFGVLQTFKVCKNHVKPISPAIESFV